MPYRLPSPINSLISTHRRESGFSYYDTNQPFLDTNLLWYDKKGFTLIEISIVLIIIGLVIGGIIIGQDLVASSRIRATVSQYEQFQSAANTFKLKYAYLPGDLPNAAAYGFTAATTGTFVRAGDGLLQSSNGVMQWSYYGPGQETTQFWRQLSVSNLIDVAIADPGSGTINPSAPNPATYFPQAKIGGQNYWLVNTDNKVNFYTMFGLSAASSPYSTTAALPNITAYALDTKIDDGMPNRGKVRGLILWGSPITLTTLDYGSSCTVGSGVSKLYNISNSTAANTLGCGGLQFKF